MERDSLRIGARSRRRQNEESGDHYEMSKGALHDELRALHLLRSMGTISNLT
ncbi:hypothetical protein AKJ09_06759 [Labilithrix luteola]|uniref:Uncharacterized protein n=1 Tax=Labilithrix luteola TaxID=1391654 RepID=A0A0K1Q2Q7_9BACT|nr:hypothetical protein AKJ09_06759 [Labilithrix luteola]